MIYFLAICSFLLFFSLIVFLVIRYFRNNSYFDDCVIPRCYGSELYKQDGFYQSSCWKCDFVGECIDRHEEIVKIENACKILREGGINVSESRLSEDQTKKEDIEGFGKED